MCGISDVSEQFGLTPRAIRFYEARGLVESRRDRFNCRRYDSRARARLKEIAAFRQAGLSIEDILEIFASDAEDPAAQRACATRKLEARLVELDAARKQTIELLRQHAGDRLSVVQGGAGRAQRLSAL